jgi:HEAT repeat protein
MLSFSHAGVRAGLALALGLAIASPLRAQPDDEKFKNAVDLYFRGKMDEALKAFQDVLAENPSNEQALQYYNAAGQRAFTLMLEQGGEFETVAKRFVELATVARKEKTDDAAAIQALVEKAMGDNWIERRDALYALSGSHGEYGAAPFVALLADGDHAKRASAIYCLTHLSSDAVLPLLAGLESGNDQVVQGCCACLGFIRDARALAGLKGVFESSANAVTKDAADRAIQATSGKSAASLPSAAQLHVEYATKHFRNDQSVATPFETKDAIWNWTGGAVVATKVPAILRHLRLAEQHCIAAIGDASAQAALLASYAGQKGALAAAKAGGAEGVPDADPALDVKLASGGVASLSAALDYSLQNDAPSSSVELLRSLEQAGATSDAMRKALNSPYKSVRYAAAFALANTGDSSEAVVKALAEALGEDAMRTVLVVDDRSESRNAMAAALRAAGYSVITADSGALGFARARTVPPKDVVVLRAKLPDVTIDQFVYDADFRTAAASMIVVADAKEAEALKTQYEGKGKVKGFVTEPVTPDALAGAVKAALPDLNHERAEAAAAAERAAGFLAHVPAASLAPVADALVHGLSRGEEPVVLGMLKALGHHGAADAAPAIAALFADSSKSEAVRVAAADALGGVFGKGGSAAPDVVKPLMDAATGDANANVRLAAGRALGAASFLSPADRAALLRGAPAK